MCCRLVQQTVEQLSGKEDTSDMCERLRYHYIHVGTQVQRLKLLKVTSYITKLREASDSSEPQHNWLAYSISIIRSQIIFYCHISFFISKLTLTKIARLKKSTS